MKNPHKSPLFRRACTKSSVRWVVRTYQFSVPMLLHEQTILSAVGQLRVANNASTSRIWRKLWKRTDRGREDDFIASGDNRQGLQYTVALLSCAPSRRATDYHSFQRIHSGASPPCALYAHHQWHQDCYSTFSSTLRFSCLFSCLTYPIPTALYRSNHRHTVLTGREAQLQAFSHDYSPSSTTAVTLL